MADDLGENLRKLRVLKGFSQEFVADEIGVSLSSYQRYENSKVGIDVQVLANLGKLYGMSLDEIYNYGEQKFDVVQDGTELYFRQLKQVDVLVRLDGSSENLQRWVKKLSAINDIL